jgi:hypothetical protein
VKRWRSLGLGVRALTALAAGGFFTLFVLAAGFDAVFFATFDIPRSHRKYAAV